MTVKLRILLNSYHNVYTCFLVSVRLLKLEILQKK